MLSLDHVVTKNNIGQRLPVCTGANGFDHMLIYREPWAQLQTAKPDALLFSLCEGDGKEKG